MQVFQGLLLKRLIKEKSFTQEEFALKMGFSRIYLQALFKYEKLSEENIQKAAKILGVNEDVFYKSTSDDFFNITRPTYELEEGVGKNEAIIMENRVSILEQEVRDLKDAIIKIQGKMLDISSIAIQPKKENDQSKAS